MEQKTQTEGTGDSAGDYCFRIRFTLGRHVRINAPGVDLTLTSVESEAPVILKSVDRTTPITEAERLALIGSGFPSEDAALAAAEQWQSALQTAFAGEKIGADFGQWLTKSSYTPAGLEWVKELHGVERVLNDHAGVMTYVCHPAPHFVSGSADFNIGKPVEALTKALTRALAHRALLTDRQRVAYDLFSASFFVSPIADARFVLLMMAVESLMTFKPRTEDVRRHIEDLIELTKSSQLKPAEKVPIIGHLDWLRKESIGQAGRRLAETLADRTYMDDPAVRFFRKCYELRSQLVHGHHPRPEMSEVGIRAANLETFVGDLICRDILGPG